jgi:hypothetical protein
VILVKGCTRALRGGAVVDSRVGSTAIRAIIAAEWVSSIGSSMTVLALPWFVLVTTGSATKLGLVLGIGSIPFVGSGQGRRW